MIYVKAGTGLFGRYKVKIGDGTKTYFSARKIAELALADEREDIISIDVRHYGNFKEKQKLNRRTSHLEKVLQKRGVQYIKNQ